ncbi:MAG: lipopolysaccharide biosynthesis protein [Sphingomonas sp.]|jgi:polysaccharide biosynthesis transport protein|nr:lipopolysaccharide biosynthesis protein [Sphingomonas sp.]HWJ59033.1 Wzz/FepE/Etk N-terminal domain-containing protein [Sphingomicrobium sp.]
MSELDAIERGGASPTWIVNHLPVILWQRRYYVLACFLVLTLAGLIAAFSMPRTYRSTATLLVQSQELPSTIVESPVTSAVEQRVARIREQVLSRGDLIQLIEQNDLYARERRSQPLSKIVEKMRYSTSVSALSSDIGQQSGTQNSTVAIAMSFEYPDPGKAQAVLQSFVAKFLSMSSEDVEDQASLTVRFLGDQANKLQTEISAIEGELTALKARNGAVLASSGSPLIDTGSFSAQITSLQSENRQLLAQARRPSGGSSLAAAEAALAAAQAQYSDTHPDVIAARERVAQLRRMGTQASDDGAVQEQIAANNAAIRQLMGQRDASLARANSAIAGQARAPAILEQAMQLESRASALRNRYQNVSENLMKAQNSARMASEQRAERLSLVEPANLPDRPYSPNRLMMIGGGAAAGLGLGLLLALGLELLGRPIRSPRQIESLGVPVLGVVPLLKPNTRPRRFGFFSREKRLAA